MENPQAYFRKLRILRNLAPISIFSLLPFVHLQAQSFQDNEIQFQNSREGVVVESRPLNIEGVIRTSSPSSQSSSQSHHSLNDRMEMEKQTNEMVQRQLEEKRLQDERKMAEKLRNIFNNGSVSPTDAVEGNVPNHAAAVDHNRPYQQMELPPSSIEQKKEFKVIPVIGNHIVTSPSENFESKIETGLGFEAQLSPRFSIGLGLRYSTMDIQEINQNRYNWYHNWYNQQFGRDVRVREIKSKRMGIEGVGKVYILPERKINPYIGLGVGYHRGELAYKSRESSSYYRHAPYWGNYEGQSFDQGKEDFSLSYFSGIVKTGLEIQISPSWGFLVEAQYSKAMMKLKSSSEDAYGYYYSHDQWLLEKIGKDIHHAPHYSLNLGLMILF